MLQDILRALLFVTMIAISGLARAEGGARLPMEVWAIGLPNGYLFMDREARVVQVTPETGVRCVVEVRGAEAGKRVEVEFAPLESRTAIDSVPKLALFAQVTGGTGFAVKRCTPAAMESNREPEAPETRRLPIRPALSRGDE
jgi:hypothetical protein